MDSFLGLYIEHGVKSSGTTIVANITAQRCIKSQAGDLAYVTDAGDGEWVLIYMMVVLGVN